jgi:hypothetical protein
LCSRLHFFEPRHSHLKGSTKRINNYLSDKFRTFGWIKPGALAEEILDRLTVDLLNLKKRDVIVISAGANNVYRNNPNEALMNIIKFIQNNGNMNIMMLGIPRRHVQIFGELFLNNSHCVLIFSGFKTFSMV